MLMQVRMMMMIMMMIVKMIMIMLKLMRMKMIMLRTMMIRMMMIMMRMMMMRMTMMMIIIIMMMRMLMWMLMLMLMAMNWPHSFHIIAVATNQDRLYCITDPCTWHVAAWKACVGNDLRPHGCGKPVAAMEAITPARVCDCNGLWPLVVESLSSWGHVAPRTSILRHCKC